MNDRPIKAAAKGISNEPFYLIQTNGSDKRHVVWFRDKVRIRTLLAGFINRAALTVDVKIRNFVDSKEGVDYSGSVDKSKLHQLMTKYEDTLFHNGYHDLMIRIPETEEYIVFDEHGLIFIYSPEVYDNLLSNLEVKYRTTEKLIYEFDHWHYCLPGGKEQLVSLLKELSLQQESY